MAISANALSLAEHAKFTNDPLVQKITWSIYDTENVLQYMPFINRKSMKANGVRWERGSLPTPTFRPINDPPTAIKASPTAFQEQAYVIRDLVQVDHLLIEDENNITDPRGAQIEAYMKGWAIKSNNYFINNAQAGTGSVVDPNAPLGLRWRIDNPAYTGIPADMKIDAGGLDFTLGMTKEEANAYLELFARACRRAKSPTGRGMVFFMNGDAKDRMATAIRIAGEASGFSSTRDNYDRSVDIFREAKIVDIGYLADETTPIISNNETAAGADGTGSDKHTSIYFAKFGQGSFFGWHYRPMKAIRSGVIDEQTADNTLLEYAYGFMQEDTRAIGRIHGLQILP